MKYFIMLGFLAVFMPCWAISEPKEVPKTNSISNAKRDVHQLLDQFHQAAAEGNKVQYLNSFSDQAVFMGTDDWERWPLPEFTKYVNKRFKNGQGWSYKPVERNIVFSKNGQIAWFDEIVVSEKWGKFRGMGVVKKQNAKWKIEQYALSFLVPNSVWKEVSEIAKKGYQKEEEKKIKNILKP